MFFGGGGIPLGIDPKDMNKENIDEENIGVLDGTPLFHRRLFDAQVRGFYQRLHQKHISKPHKEFLDIDALIEFRNNNEDYCNEENSDKSCLKSGLEQKVLLFKLILKNTINQNFTKKEKIAMTS